MKYAPLTCYISNIISHIFAAHRDLVGAEDSLRDGKRSISGLLLRSADHHRTAAAVMFNEKIGSAK